MFSATEGRNNSSVPLVSKYLGIVQIKRKYCLWLLASVFTAVVTMSKLITTNPWVYVTSDSSAAVNYLVLRYIFLSPHKVGK